MSELLGVITPDNDLFDELATDPNMRETYIRAQTQYANACLKSMGYISIERMKYDFHLPVDPYNDLRGFVYTGPCSWLKYDVIPVFREDTIISMTVTVECHELISTD